MIKTYRVFINDFHAQVTCNYIVSNEDGSIDFYYNQELVGHFNNKKINGFILEDVKDEPSNEEPFSEGATIEEIQSGEIVEGENVGENVDELQDN